MVYQILRRQSGAQPEIRRHDEQQFENGPIQSTCREWVDGKQVRYLGEYDLPEDLHATGHYVILSWRKESGSGKLITYRKYPSGAYEKLASGFGRENIYHEGTKVSRDELPADVREREEHRELMYTTRGTARYREEAFAVPDRPPGHEYRRVLIDGQFVCVIEELDLYVQKTDARGKVYIVYDVIWPDGSREAWENHVFKAFGDRYRIGLQNLFPTSPAIQVHQQDANTAEHGMPPRADMRAMLCRLHTLSGE